MPSLRNVVLAAAVAYASFGWGPEVAVLDFEEPPIAAPFEVAYEPALVHQTAQPLLLGLHRGDFQMTYYWVAGETADAGQKKIRDASCRPIAKVSRKFERALRREGTGRLSDGRLVNVAGGCRCGTVCYAVADELGEWGVGVLNRPLEPFRSIAVDPRRISVGTWIYVAELDGMWMPGSSGYGEFIHDGCVVADDRGGGVRGRHIDFFAGLRSHYRQIHGRHRLSTVNVYEGGSHCLHHGLMRLAMQ